MPDDETERAALPRRRFLEFGVFATVAAAGAGLLSGKETMARQGSALPGTLTTHEHLPSFQGKVVPEVTANGFNPTSFLTSFDYGKTSRLSDGRTLREYQVRTVEAEIEVASGVMYPAWTYNGQVPGPTLRCTEGDLVRVHFVNNSSHPHTLHFHGIHTAAMDGVFEQVGPGGEFTYEFTAEPFGLHLYHCHTMPIKKHIEKGLYGTFVIDPRTPRLPAKELVMVMNGFDTNFDGENEVYTVNGVANYYLHNPIQLRVGEPVRIYLVNITEFDLLNSIHIHANFFRHFKTGTSLDHYEYTDTAILGQGERSVLEFSYSFPGKYMFHAHQSEFAELGWMGLFEVA